MGTRSFRRSTVTATVFCLGALTACQGLDRSQGESSSDRARTPSAPVFHQADSVVQAWVDDGRIPGAVLRIERDGQPLMSRAYGAAHAFDYGAGQYDRPGGIVPHDPAVPMEIETVFDLASVTKVMATTMAVMLLVDRGELELDAPVSRYLTDFTGGDRDSITSRHLLTHTSGLPQWVPVYYHASNADEAYRYLRGLPTRWPVGEGRHYSDLGFMLLGRIVESVSGTTLDRYLREALYGPLGLTATTFNPADGKGAANPSGGEGVAATSHGNPYERRMVHDPDFGYQIGGDATVWDEWRERTLRGEVNDGNAFHAFGGVAGHAGLFSTASDLGVLLDLLLGEGERDGQRFLSAETVKSFLTPATEGQALGWQLPDHAPEGSFGHTGFTGTFVLGVPEQRLSVILLTNRQNVGVDAETRYPDIAPLQRAVTEAVVRAVMASPQN